MAGWSWLLQEILRSFHSQRCLFPMKIPRLNKLRGWMWGDGIKSLPLSQCHYIDWFTGVLIVAYSTPYITGQDFTPCIQQITRVPWWTTHLYVVEIFASTVDRTGNDLWYPSDLVVASWRQMKMRMVSSLLKFGSGEFPPCINGGLFPREWIPENENRAMKWKGKPSSEAPF